VACNVNAASTYAAAAVSYGDHRRQFLAQAAVIAMICVSLLTPGLSINGNLPTFKAEVVLLPVIVAIYLWLLMAGQVHIIRLNGMLIAGALFCVCVALSLWYGSAVLGHGLILRDLYEIPKACLPVIFFTFAYEAKLCEPSLRRLFRYFSGALFLLCLYAWAQFFRVGFSYQLNAVYSAGEHVDYSLQVLNRVYSTMGNPNVLGQLMDWGLAAFLLALFFGVGSRAWNMVLLVSCFITLAMTASRYGMLGAVVVFILAAIILVSSLRNRKRVFQLALLSICAPLFFLIFQVVQSSTRGVSDRFAELSHPLQVDSVRVRLDTVWRDALVYVAASPWLGHGPAKNIFTDVITDSEYLDILKEFGVVGFLPYLAYFLIPLAMIVRGIRVLQRAGPRFESQYPATCLVMFLAFIMVVTALLMNVGESTFHNAPLQGFIWMWLGLGARAARSVADISGLDLR